VVLALVSLARAQPYTDIKVDPFPDPIIVTFDPTQVQDPPLEPGEAGDQATSVGIAVGMPGFTQIPGDGVSVNGQKVEVSAKNTIRLPTDASQALKDHEQGHSDLSAYEYNQTAYTKTAAAFNGYGSSPFANQDAAIADLKNRASRAQEAISWQIDYINSLYDLITDHGKNDFSPDVKTAQQGVAAVIAARNSMPPAGLFDYYKEPGLSYGGVGDPAQVFLDSTTGQISFGGQNIFDNAADPADTIVGRGQVEISPMIWIGLQDNGSVLLSDTALTITDSVTGDTLMSAFLDGLAYLPSNKPGYAGMIQGYLYIPPGGIYNSIGSDFLTGMQNASQTGLTQIIHGVSDSARN